MKTIKLTEASENFTFITKTTDVVLNWEVSLLLTDVQFITLTHIQMNYVIPFKDFDDPNFIPIYCNLIERTATNPKREIHRTLLPAYDSFINDSHGSGK